MTFYGFCFEGTGERVEPMECLGVWFLLVFEFELAKFSSQR